METADAVVAEDDEEFFVGLSIQVLQAGGDGVHRDELGVTDAGDGVLKWLADIDEGGLAGGEFLLGFEGGDFEGWGHIGGSRSGGVFNADLFDSDHDALAEGAESGFDLLEAGGAVEIKEAVHV